MNANNKYICIHGHFYQPPRENAWLEVVEFQGSAVPFHDWNDRINFECYAPNTAARILDDDQVITRITNNYSRISYNFGPTLLSWMQKADPDTYRTILESGQASRSRFNGHSSAMAQIYSHLIMPLANRRDKETQVIWGIRDFTCRFGYKPEGMWLAETAVDTETLEILADNNIAYTILAPRQARAFRKIGENNWTVLPGENIDTRRPYLCQLPSGKNIALFFYHGEIAQDVAFNGLLNNGKHFAQRFINAFDDDGRPQLVHIATDGESYGHHHRNGEMALADCLTHIEDNELATITNYGEFLENFPPEYEVQIHENSSWSCVHGVERWGSNCGCNTGGNPGWSQDWRAPLRDTLNWLRDQLLPVYKKEASKYIKNIWKARNDYIKVLLHSRSEKIVKTFFKTYRKNKLSLTEKTKLLRLMEMQYNAILMFTSCGWFFDEISGIETNQILQYANRAIHYAGQVSGIDLHDEFMQRLEAIPSNVFEDGSISYKKYVAPSRVDLVRVGMHYAVSSLFEEHPEHLDFFNYIADSEVFERYEAGNQILSIGRTTVKSKISLSQKHFSFAVLYVGQQNMIGNISVDMNKADFDSMSEQIIEAFKSPNLGNVLGIMQTYFDSEKFTIWHLFRDEKRKILKQITDNNLRVMEMAFRDIYKDNYQLMTGIAQSDIPIPEAYKSAVQFIINRDLHQFFENGSLSIRELNHLAGEFKKWEVQLTNEQSLKLAASERIFKEIKGVEVSDISLKQLQKLNNILETLKQMGVELNIWKSQNLFFSILKGYKNGQWVFSNKEWEEAFSKLGRLLNVK